jgi:gliding motility-associated-like protein
MFQAEYDRSLGLKIDFQMVIFNKWGEELFRTNDIDKGWDGTFKGKPCPPDEYTWTVRFAAPSNFRFNQTSPQMGTVMLLR